MVTGSSSTTKRWAEVLFIGFIFFKDGNQNGKRASLSHLAFQIYFSRVFFYDLFTDRQPQSSAFSHLFCGKEGVENSLFRLLCDSDSGIGNGDFQPSSIL